MKNVSSLVGLAVLLAGCATTTYTNSVKGNDPQAMQSALDKCEKSSQAACSPPGDNYRICIEGKVKSCMQAEGWTQQ